MRDETWQDVFSAGEIGTKYDQAAKVLWRNREILAPLLKYAIKELEDEPVESIIRLIDADSISEDVPVSDLPGAIVSRGIEQNSTTERPITYDFRFKVKNPKLSSAGMLVMLHINLEFQNRYRPVLKDGRTYPIIKRGIYYAAREISAQLGRITQKTNYNDIEKVVSIWLVSEGIPKELQNTVTRYYIEKEDYYRDTDEPAADYDLMEVVIIRQGEKSDITRPIFDYLDGIYRADIETIDKYTPASDNPEIKREVADMPGMSQTIYKNGYDSGYGSGYDSGYGSGIISLVSEGDITIERAAEKLNKPVDEIQKLLKEYAASARKKEDA